MTLKIDNFHGMQPRLHPSLLSAGMAVRAHNCRLKSGKLVPLRNPSVVSNSRVYKEGGLTKLSDATSLHAWKWLDNTGRTVVSFLAFKGMTWMAEGNIADDEYDRVFITGDTGVSYDDGTTVTENTPAVFIHERSGNNVIRHTLVKSPITTFSAADTGDPAFDDTKTVFYVAFFASWYDEFGYESGLTGATEIIEINAGSVVEFTFDGIPPDADGVRVYMTMSGTEDSNDGIQFLLDCKVSALVQGKTSHAVYPEDTGETEPGIEPIPSDLRCLQFVPGGFYTGFSASAPKTVMFSDINLVTSWPVAYRYDVKDTIVALAVTSNTVFALTDGWPWVLSGTAPESMTAAKLAGPAACVSPRGVCVYRNSVYYASNEGLMAIVNDANSGTVCVNVTEKIFTKDQWQAKNPSSCILQQHDGALHMFFKRADGSPDEGLVLDLNESADAVTTHDEAAQCACVDNVTDTMYFVRDLTEEV